MSVNVGDVWKRRVELHDSYDVVRVVGRVFMGEGEPDDFTITPANEFGGVIQTDAAGLLDHCERLSEAAQGTAWEY
jgi:hypothetical protein